MISVDDYPLTLRIQKWVFSGCTVLPDSNETELRSSDQEATHLQVKILCAWKCVPTVISSGVDISEVPGGHLLQKMSSQ